MGARKRKTALLALLAASSALGPGFQNLPVMSFVNIACGLALAFLAQDWKDVALAATTEILGEWTAYMFIFGAGPQVLLSLAFAVAIVVSFGLVTFPLLSILPQRFDKFSPERAGVLIFPICFTAFFSIVILLAPTGSWASFGYFSLNWGTLVQMTALFGLDGIHFLMSWASSLVFYFYFGPKLISMHVGSGRVVANTPTSERVDEDSQEDARMLNDSYGSLISYYRRFGDPGDLEDELRKEGYVLKRRRHISRFIMSVLIVFVISEIRLLDTYHKFFQRDIQKWEQDKINAVCLAGYEKYGTVEERLNTTESVAKQALFVNASLEFEKPDLIVWSETSVRVRGKREENSYIQKMQNISAQTGTMIGFGYLYELDEPTPTGYKERNMFVLVDSGKYLFGYQKVHPVIGVETSVEPGHKEAPVVETRFGTIGAAICFDYDFPNFIRSASHGAQIMIQPGWDWGPIGTLHARMDALRAVENGFTLFRCSSGGVSGVYDPYGNVVTETIIGTDMNDSQHSMMAYTVQIPLIKRAWTLYTYIGGALGYCCVLSWLFMMAIAFLPMQYVIQNETVTYYLRPLPTIDL